MIDAAYSNEPERSPHWRATERLHRLKQPNCLVCGNGPPQVAVNVHHWYPFDFVVQLGRPDLERDERNLYTICVDHEEEHHILVGHLDDYRSYNPRLHEMISLCRGLTAVQIRALPAWQEAVKHRPKHLADMSAADKKLLRAELDRILPKAA